MAKKMKTMAPKGAMKAGGAVKGMDCYTKGGKVKPAGLPKSK